MTKTRTKLNRLFTALTHQDREHARIARYFAELHEMGNYYLAGIVYREYPLLTDTFDQIIDIVYPLNRKEVR